jgi:hypothetical protein
VLRIHVARDAVVDAGDVSGRCGSACVACAVAHLRNMEETEEVVQVSVHGVLELLVEVI